MAAGLIDLNTVEDDETLSFGSLSPSSSSSASANAALTGSVAATASSSSVCLELWHACAGPLISLPKKGSVVVYFPQGHLEQTGSEFPTAVFDLPPHVFCRVVDVKLHAEVATDEVYAQVSLLPENEQNEQKLCEWEMEADAEDEDFHGAAKSSTPHMFCKTLTASDTSSHGGFSVPRRAAEDCFPPLDYTQQRPSQELVAKDLHGVEWRFRHIYRGQPRRHLLTTGWSAFVNRKKLVSGDAVLFLRGADGELRLGIRRASQIKSSATFTAMSDQQRNQISFPDVVNAISRRSVFSIFYNPRASSSEFIVPLSKFTRSLEQSFSVGMRFKMRFEAEDAAERRYTGLITGIGDMDPVRWPGSKWRCLLVRWDDMEANRHSRVSPWEIEPSGSVSSCNGLMVPGSKRTRIGLPSAPDLPVPNGTGSSDFGESLRFQKVLQGQEILGFDNPYSGVNTQHQHQSDARNCFPRSNGPGVVGLGNRIRNPVINFGIPSRGIGLGESVQFHKVLQGQEIFSSQSHGRGPTKNNGQEAEAHGILNGVQVPTSGNGWSILMQGYSGLPRGSAPRMQVSSPSSVLMFQQASNPVLNLSSVNLSHSKTDGGLSNRNSLYVTEKNGGKFPLNWGHYMSGKDKESGSMPGVLDEHKRLASSPVVTQSACRGGQELVSSCKSSCRLFGFSLTEEKHATKEDNPSSGTTPLSPGLSFLPFT